MTKLDYAKGDEPASAILSDDGLYRYSLLRTWTPGLGSVMFVMLNPSTADASKDDPTIRRCVGFAKAWGFGGLIVTNLYAYRATKPDDLWSAQSRGVDIVGPEADGWIRAHAASNAKLIVAAWGNNGEPQRIWRVQQALRGYDVHALGLTAAHQPRHPLYVRGATEPTIWRRAVAAPEEPK